MYEEVLFKFALFISAIFFVAFMFFYIKVTFYLGIEILGDNKLTADELFLLAFIFINPIIFGRNLKNYGADLLSVAM